MNVKILIMFAMAIIAASSINSIVYAQCSSNNGDEMPFFSMNLQLDAYGRIDGEYGISEHSQDGMEILTHKCVMIAEIFRNDSSDGLFTAHVERASHSKFFDYGTSIVMDY